MLSILQWNINGYFNNYIDLEIVIKIITSPSSYCGYSQFIPTTDINNRISLSTAKPIKPGPLWWNSELSPLNMKKQNAWHEFKRTLTESNFIMQIMQCTFSA